MLVRFCLSFTKAAQSSAIHTCSRHRSIQGDGKKSILPSHFKARQSVMTSERLENNANTADKAIYKGINK